MSPLSSDQTNTLRVQLQRRQAELRQLVQDELRRSQGGRYAELAGQVHDAGDASVADLLVDLDLRQLDTEIKELRAVEHAMQEMRTGGYGLCTHCGGEILFERLRVMPHAQMCINCQAHHEKTHVGGTTPSM
ncbi:MAG: TraR/DksA family transcriptional regulator [Gammaproteobacteria bacterium]|nr:TraR/DksA family transcriptional regulator [Gammaproteobacteria bacterium]